MRRKIGEDQLLLTKQRLLENQLRRHLLNDRTLPIIISKQTHDLFELPPIPHGFRLNVIIYETSTL